MFDSPKKKKYNVSSWYEEHVSNAIGGTEKIKAVYAKAQTETGVRGQFTAPKYTEDIFTYSFDDKHINQERDHNVTREEAEQFIRESSVCVVRWKGTFKCYAGENGTVYVDIKNKNIRTAYKKIQYVTE